MSIAEQEKSPDASLLRRAVPLRFSGPASHTCEPCALLPNSLASPQQRRAGPSGARSSEGGDEMAGRATWLLRAASVRKRDAAKLDGGTRLMLHVPVSRSISISNYDRSGGYS
uniref:Uncharacterized protein n=1 Tax=Plectus sambesii TaxID=2011161 RepID=A0A914UN61_9BILA